MPSPRSLSGVAAMKPVAVVNIGSSFFLSNWMFTWVFRLIRTCRSIADVRQVKLRLPDDILTARNSKLLEEAWRNEVKLSPAPSVLSALRAVYSGHYVWLGLYKIFWGVFTWTGTSVVLYFFIDTLQKFNTNQDYGILHVLAVLFLVTSFLSSLCIHQLYAECAKEGFRVKSALTSLVFKKAMVLARVKGGSGEIINIVSSDVSRIQDAVLNFHFLWTSAIEVVVILGLAGWLMEWYAFTSVGIILCLIPIQVYLGKLTSKVQHEVSSITTQRVHIMSEVLTAIKLIKFYAWEKPFTERISKIRSREIHLLRKTLFIKAINFTIVFAAPVVIAAVAITIYSQNNASLPAAISFTTISIYNTLRYPLLMLPQSIKSITGAQVSLAHITQYLTQAEISPIPLLSPPDPHDEEDDEDLQQKLAPLSSSSTNKSSSGATSSNVENKSRSSTSDAEGEDGAKILLDAPVPASTPGPASLTHKGDRKPLALEMKNATFTWEGEQNPSLVDISIKVRHGEVLAVIGDVGSGKSSFIAALLGQVKQTGGERVKMYGTTSYVPQEAWMLNFTLRENILFGSEYNRDRYDTTIHVCALERDLTLFAAGDETEIAERGANLSGGQRQRASLARAVYNDADIVLLDDPLSAVDQAVGRHIFEKCILSHLREKTVIMVTHQLQYLEQVDQILHLKNGKIARYGKFATLMANDPEFAELINNHVASGEDGDDDVEAMPLNPTVDNHMTVKPSDDSLENAVELNQLTVKSLKNLNINQGTISSMLERNQLSVIRNDDHSHNIAAVIQRNELTIHSISEMDIYAYTNATDQAEQLDVDEVEIAKRIFGKNAMESENDDFSSEKDGKIGDLTTGNNLQNQSNDQSNGVAASTNSFDNPNSRMALTSSSALDGQNGNDATGKSSQKVHSKSAGAAGGSVPRVSGKLVGEDTSAQHLGWGNYLLYSKTGSGALISLLIVIFFFGVHSIRLTSDVIMRDWIKSTQNTKVVSSTGEKGGTDYVLWYIVAVVGFTIGIFCRGMWFAYEAAKKAREFHDHMFHRIMRAPMSFFDATPLGRILSAFAKHQFHIDETMPDALFQALQYIPLTIGAIILVSINGWESIPTTVIFTFIGVFAVFWAMPAENMLKSAEASTKPPIFSHLATSLEGLFSIRAYGAQARFELLNQQKLDANHEYGLSLAMLKSWTAFYLDFVTTLVIYCVALMFAIFPTRNNELRHPEAGLSMSNVLQILVFLQWSVRMIGDIQEQISSVGIINYYSTKVKQEAPAEVPDRKPPATWPSRGEIEFKDVVLKYHEFGVAVLKKVTFTIRPREKVGIVGRTGSGKSTLLVSLLRIVELAEGCIKIDGIDISVIGLNDLREQVAIIPQEPVLFVGTIRSNLDPFSKSTDEEIWRALDSVHLSGSIRRMANQLDSEVIENGKNFSLGQRQLFCIARAIISRTKILVLDEATAAIDMQTDALIQTAIKENFADLTVLTIAHRLNTIIESDKVLVMEAGRAVEFDSPVALLNTPNGHFAQLVSNTGEATSRKLRELAQAAYDLRKD